MRGYDTDAQVAFETGEFNRKVKSAVNRADWRLNKLERCKP
jgi:hypothetical protein